MAIQGGAKLKSVKNDPPAAKAPPSGRDGLLAQIALGAKLKHVEAPDEKAPAPKKTEGADLAATLASALARLHKAQESNSDSDDSHWDD